MKQVIITGVSRGLGKCLCEQLCELDIKLICIGRTFPNISVTSNVCFIQYDLSIYNDDLCKKIEANIDLPVEIILINNAGIVTPIGAIGNLSEVMMLNASMVNYVIPMIIVNRLVYVVKKSHGKLMILNISTGAAKRPIVGWGNYCSSKAGFNSFLNVLEQQEEKNQSIRIVHIDPGVMNTDMQEEIRSARREEFPQWRIFQDYHIKGKLRMPNEVAAEIIREYII